jgi:hypothetical protein
VYGGAEDEEGGAAVQTADGGYLIAGYTLSNSVGSEDVYVIKTDASGDSSWTRRFGGSGEDAAADVRQTSDGGVIIVGHTASYGAGNMDVYLIKTDADGDNPWAETFGGGSFDLGKSIREVADGGFIIAGYTDSYGAGNNDAWVIRTGAAGDTLWTRTFGGNGVDRGYALVGSLDGGFAVGGVTASMGSGGNDVYLIKMDSEGNTE